MTPDAVRDRVKRSFPRVLPGGADFYIQLNDCKVEFFCSSTTVLEFSIIPTDAANPNRTVRAVTAAELLVRSTDTIWHGLQKSLRCGVLGKRPKMDRCAIEDSQSRSTLLVRDDRSPLVSPGAKVAYVASFLFAIVGAALIYWQLRDTGPVDSQGANILSIALSLGVAAFSMPVPIFVNWIQWRKSLVWRYVRAGQ